MKETNEVISDLPNVSLVAFYGEKAPRLKALIQKLQACLTEHKLIKSFSPYQLEQVHGTIIGCEGVNTGSGVINKWFYNLRKETRYINISGLIDYLQYQANFPLNIRFGGYDLNIDYNFLSCQQHPYFRSFQLQRTSAQAIPVMIGWSCNDNCISWAMYKLRQDLRQFNLLHKYHGNLQDVDNDFYLRLGTIDSKLNIQAIEIIAEDIRKLLASQPALSLPILLKDLAFAQYQDLSLTPAKTKIISATKIDQRQLEKLYPKSVATL